MRIAEYFYYGSLVMLPLILVSSIFVDWRMKRYIALFAAVIIFLWILIFSWMWQRNEKIINASPATLPEAYAVIGKPNCLIHDDQSVRLFYAIRVWPFMTIREISFIDEQFMTSMFVDSEYVSFFSDICDFNKEQPK